MNSKNKWNKKHPYTTPSPKTLITFTEPKSFITEQFKTIRTNIHFSLPGEETKKY